jgi:hypothetical protein
MTTPLVKYVYHNMITGHNLAYGFTVPDDKSKGGTIAVGFAFGSPKDSFSRKKARAIIASFMVSRPIVLVQQPGRHILDVIGDYINSIDFHQIMPPSWQGKFKGGLRQRKVIVLTEVSEGYPRVDGSAQRLMEWPITDVPIRIHRDDWVAATKVDAAGNVIPEAVASQ